jgi:hypothetical protein
MIQNKEITSQDKALSPCALYAGLVLSFVACSAAGYYGKDHNPYVDFGRFHAFISPLSGFYPTACQVRALAKSTLTPEKIAVIVGGNSILQGYAEDSVLWTEKLQRMLGDDYQVINFAMCSAQPIEFGGTAAEILSNDFKRVILITNGWPGTVAGAGVPDGSLYRYFFWDAYYKGLVSADQPRENQLREMEAQRADDAVFAELKVRSRMDSFLYFEDLWNRLAYTRISTVWYPLLGAWSSRPRKKYADVPPGRSWPTIQDPSLAGLRQVIRGSVDTSPIKEAGRLPADGASVPTCSPLQLNYKLCFPEPYRKRTLVLITHDNPRSVKLLSSQERFTYEKSFAATIAELEGAGFTALEIGKNFGDRDYIDRCHLSPPGGTHLAEEVAPKVRELAQSLGYVVGSEP